MIGPDGKFIASEELRQRWEYKVLEMCDGNKTAMGCVILAALGKGIQLRPRFAFKAKITKDGVIAAHILRKNDELVLDAHICRVPEMIKKLRELANACNLSDDDYRALFQTVRNWIAKDERPAEQRNNLLG